MRNSISLPLFLMNMEYCQAHNHLRRPYRGRSVGDIKGAEFDDAETDAIRCIGTDEYEIEGSTKLDDLNDVLGTEIESDDYVLLEVI